MSGCHRDHTIHIQRHLATKFLLEGMKSISWMYPCRVIIAYMHYMGCPLMLTHVNSAMWGHSQRVLSCPPSGNLGDFRLNFEEHLGRRRRPLPDGLSVSNDSSDGVDRVGAKLVLPVVVVVQLQLDADQFTNEWLLAAASPTYVGLTTNYSQAENYWNRPGSKSGLWLVESNI